jgi:tRNA1(Val) A37 N6-methylase TrmN6
VSDPVTAPTTDDAFLGGALQMLQPQNSYRAGLDAVLLAAAASILPGTGARVLDVGAGVGVVGLAVAWRVADAHVTLVERDPQLAALARANIARNQLSDRARLIEADVSRPLGELSELGSLVESFDCALANPPYHAHGRGTPARDSIKANANAMPDGDLDRWARFMTAMLRPGGSAVVIHKAEALPELLGAFPGRFGDLLLMPIHPREGSPANRVILRGIKGSRAPLRIRAGLVLHDADGGSRPDMEAILRHGAGLDLDA